MVGAELLGGHLTLGVGAGDDCHFGAEGLGQTDAHHAQAAEAHDAHAHARACTKILEGIVHGDCSAHEGPRLFQGVRLGNLDGVLLVNDHLRRVATEGVHALESLAQGRSAILVDAVVSPRHSPVTILLIALLAVLALSAAVNDAAHAHVVALLELGYLGAHGHANARELVARHTRVHATQVTLSDVQVTVAHAAVLHLHLHVEVAKCAALEVHRAERARAVRARHSDCVDTIGGRHLYAGEGRGV
mmetsp:Transcript_26816/g.72329  ORF Transcript_26816/g.72329 Transcript_26816/m.72329 type:complete len:246 (+) Transcript_26816:813-1550(+)